MSAQHASQRRRARRSTARSVRPQPEVYRLRDVTAVAVILVVVVVLGVVVWVTGDRFQSSLTHGEQATQSDPITREPHGLKLLWEAASPVTESRLLRGPITAGTVVVTGAGDTVTGRSPLTGEMVWQYRRPSSLCGLEAAWGGAITVWQFPAGCGDVVMVKGDGGLYGPMRSGEALGQRRIVTGGKHVLSWSEAQLSAWRSDMVQTMRIGATTTPLEPGQVQVEKCHIIDATENDGVVGVVSRCTGLESLRLTFYNAVPEEDVEPEILGQWVTSSRHATVVDVHQSRALVYLSTPEPHFAVVRFARAQKEGGNQAERTRVVVEEEYPADRGTASLLGIPVTRTDKSLFWNDGSHLYAFDAQTFELKWSMNGVVGTPGVLSNLVDSPRWLVVPVRGGLALVDGNTGEQGRLLPLAGSQVRKVAVFGGVIVAQQGAQIRAFAPLWD